MVRTKQQRRRNRRLPDAAVPATPPSAPPTGPAGGDLGGTYPNPTVQSIGNVAAGGDLSGMYPNPTISNISGVAAGGDLSGNYPNPTVNSIVNAIAAYGGYPPGDAGNLTNLHSDQLNGALPAIDASALVNVPAPPTLKSGVGNLDGNGSLDLSGLTSASFAVGAWYNTQGYGQILTLGAPLRIASTYGSGDAGYTVVWIAF